MAFIAFIMESSDDIPSCRSCTAGSGPELFWCG